MAKSRMTIRTAAFVSAMLLAAAWLWGGGVPATAARADKGASLVVAVAQREGIPVADLRLLNQASMQLKLTGLDVTRAKVVEQRTGALYGVAVDQNGQAVDLEAAEAAELRAYRAAYGTMTTDLAARVARASATKPLAVGFWLRSDAASLATRTPLQANASAAQVRAAEEKQQANEQRIIRSIAKTNQSFVRFLRRQGYQVLYVSTLSPSVFATVPASAVADLSRKADVISTAFAGAKAAETQDVAKVTTAATKVFAKGITGAATNVSDHNVGVVECCDSLFNGANNYWLARYVNAGGACAGTHSHPTAVMGVILSTHPKFTGHAYNANAWFNHAPLCDGSEAGVNSAIDDVVANVDGPVNHSYGVATTAVEPCPPVGTFLTTVKKLDDAVRIFADSQYVAAGNDGNTRCVSAPGNGWNITTVGAFDDHNTTSWTGDTMATFSSGGDPGSDNGDRAKPEVAGPGVNFNGLLPSAGGTSTGNIGSGTSFASPLYAGGGALADERRPFLKVFPETEKAVMLTSACHNIEGGLTFSELDGAGGPDFLEMDNILSANHFRGESVANGSGVAFTQAITSVTVGQRIRAAIAWDTNTSYSLYTTDPSDDLDLLLFDPNGTFRAASSTFDNNYEVLDFPADIAGTWSIQVNRFRTSDPAGSTFIGTAWHHFAPSVCASP